MPRYVAFLRGVSPQNASMAALRECLEQAGYGAVRTVLASGNVVFDARASAPASLERRLEKVIATGLGRPFATLVRPSQYLQALLDDDPFSGLRVPKEAKRVVTFLRQPMAQAPKLPIVQDDVRILKVVDREVFAVYVPGPKGPVFMRMLESTFGKEITTRTLDTVTKCAAA